MHFSSTFILICRIVGNGFFEIILYREFPYMMSARMRGLWAKNG